MVASTDLHPSNRNTPWKMHMEPENREHSLPCRSMPSPVPCGSLQSLLFPGCQTIMPSVLSSPTLVATNLPPPLQPNSTSCPPPQKASASRWSRIGSSGSRCHWRRSSGIPPRPGLRVAACSPTSLFNVCVCFWICCQTATVFHCYQI